MVWMIIFLTAVLVGLALIANEMNNNKDINNLGEFANISDVWERYPEGGAEGDYLFIGGVKYRWDKYNLMWANAEVVTETRSYEVKDFYGDVNVHHNLTVAGTLRAKRLKQPNLGLFATYDALVAAHPSPEVGQWACVGNSTPADIYRCDTAGVWTATGEQGGVDNLSLDGYKNDLDSMELRLNQMQDTVDEQIQAIQTATVNGVDSISTAQSEAVEEVSEVQSQAVDAVETAKTNAVDAIGNAGTNATNAVGTAKSGALSDINTAKTGALSQINTAVVNGVDSISTAQSEAVAEIEEVYANGRLATEHQDGLMSKEAYQMLIQLWNQVMGK